MATTHTIGAIDEAIGRLTFPTTKSEAALRIGDVSVRVGDRDTKLSKVVNKLDAERFESAEEMLDAIYASLPADAGAEA